MVLIIFWIAVLLFVGTVLDRLFGARLVNWWDRWSSRRTW
jgi:uncharacterized membrane protein